MSRTSRSIIVYHAIGECSAEDDPHHLFVSTETFSEQMEFLAEHRVVVPLDEIVERPHDSRGGPLVAITFDDAYRNVLTEAAPILARLGFPATSFAPTKWLGRRNEWLEPSRCAFDIMQPEEILEAENLGIRTESHGHAHIDMAVRGPSDVATDLEESIHRLSDILGRRPRYLAYPYGRFSSAAAHVASDVGFGAAFTIDSRHKGRFAFGRVPISPLDGKRTFRWKTSGLWLRYRHSVVGGLAAGAVRPWIRRR